MKKIIICAAVVASGILLSGISFAQTQTPKQKNQSIARCEIIGRNLDKRILSFETNMKKHTTQYQKTENRITGLVTKLEAEGYDVSALRVDLVELESKITKFETDYSTYIADLEDTKEFTCSRSSAEFKARLAIARAQLKVVHDDSVDIRTFWAKTIKPKIVELKKPAITETITVEGGLE